jgi:hypothetical protein
MQRKGGPYLVVLVLLGVSGCATEPTKITLVNPKTEKTVICPDGLFESRMMSNDQAAQQIAWHAEFQRTNNRLPTPMEGCIKLYEILGFVRKG